ncbi:Tamavidin2, avidin-like biotin-binding proteins from an edible mushroom [Mycena polygramma]|nr:Tamavidin2, avidin-like biotin-binding proteins from an edible mushroom [Mycena polygramma]
MPMPMGQPVDLLGHWYNELGSKMILVADDCGNLHGQYNSKVGEAEDFYVLTGRFDADPPGPTDDDPTQPGVSVGWVVTYRNYTGNSNSTATWSGQFFDKDDSGDQRILTHWLLSWSTVPKRVWSSTLVGHDTFTRDKPSDAAIAHALAHKHASPYPEEILAATRRRT